MPIGLLRGPAPARVDHHEAASSSPDRFDAAGPIWSRGQASIGRIRVGPKNQEVIGAIQIGNSNGETAAEQPRVGQLLGALIDRAGREEVLGPQRPQERLDVEDAGEVVRVGIAQIRTNGVSSVLGHHGQKQTLYLGKGLRPGCGDQLAITAHQWTPQAIGVLVELTQGRALGTDETVAEHVVAVASYARDLLVLYGQLKATGCLTQRTGTEGDVVSSRHEFMLPGSPLPC